MELPKRGKGRMSVSRQAEYDQELNEFCDYIEEINSRLNFKVSARGWAYILEQEAGLIKSEFDDAQKLIADCRKKGLLPLDIVAEDSARQFYCVECVDDTTPEEEADYLIRRCLDGYMQYNNLSFWEDKDCYLQMLVEKVDLREMFKGICDQYRIPIANARGWADISQRAEMMERFKFFEEQGKQPILLYCGDHDPSGLNITEHLKNNLKDLEGATGWNPENLIIDRFGLNHDFIREHELTWIDNLITGSGKDLAKRKHKDHFKPYVQNYIRQFGVRKCEANALVVRVKAGRKLCHDSILKYLPEDAPEQYELKMSLKQHEVKEAVKNQLAEMFSA